MRGAAYKTYLRLNTLVAVRADVWRLDGIGNIFVIKKNAIVGNPNDGRRSGGENEENAALEKGQERIARNYIYICISLCILECVGLEYRIKGV